MREYIFKIFAYLSVSTFTNLSFSQNLSVDNGGLMQVSSGEVLFVGGNLSIHASGDLTVESNSTKSASLIVSGSATGVFTYKRHVPNNWRLTSSPVTSQSIPAFVANGSNSVLESSGKYAIGYYNNINSESLRWVYHHTSPTLDNEETLTDFIPGQGYATQRTSAGEFTYTGGLSTSDVTLGISNAATSHFWHSVGNPFPSFLPGNNNASGTNLISENSDVFDPSYTALYLWNGTAYEVLNHSSPALNIPPGQGFMVRAKDNTEDFTFGEALQFHLSGNATFYRSNAATPSIVVNLSNENTTQTTTLKYLEKSTTGLDPGYDAGTFRSGTSQFSIDSHLVSDSNGVDFMLQCLPTNSYETLVVPLSVRADKNKQFTFSVTSSNLPDGIEVYLEDIVTNTITNISKTPYVITPTETLSGIGRFYIHTSAKTLSVDDVVNNSLLNIYKTENYILRVTGLKNNNSPAILKVYSILGNEVKSHVLNTALIQEDVLLPSWLPKGIYIANISYENGSVSKKIVIE